MISNGAKTNPKGSSLVPIKGNSFSERLVDVELVPGGGMNLENIILTHLSLPALLWMHACMHLKVALLLGMCKWQYYSLASPYVPTWCYLARS